MSSRGFRGPKHCDECFRVRADVDYVIANRNEREREREDADKKQEKWPNVNPSDSRSPILVP